jgi:hypothetical protein
MAQVTEFSDRTYITWRVTFEPTDGKTCEEQREQYDAFLDDAGFVDCRKEKTEVRPHHLRVYLNLEPPSAECDHTDCDDPPTTLFVAPEGSVHGQDYYQEHADRLADSLLTYDGGMTHVEEMWADG